MMKCEAAGLRREASLCRSLADVTNEPPVAEQLRRMADEYEEQAARLEGCAHPSKVQSSWWRRLAHQFA